MCDTNHEAKVAYYSNSSACEQKLGTPISEVSYSTPSLIFRSLIFTPTHTHIHTDNMCRPLNDQVHYTAFSSWDSIYPDVASQEPNILRGGCTSVPDIVSPKCSTLTGEDFSASACMIVENCNNQKSQCGFACNQLNLIGHRMKSLDTDVFSSMEVVHSDVQFFYSSKNSLTNISEGVFENFTNLAYIYVPDNLIESLSSGVFDGPLRNGLFALDLSMNRLKDISFLSEGPPLANLQYLKIYSNLISELPSLGFTNVPNLGHLMITDNPIRVIRKNAFQTNNGVLTELNLRGMGLELVEAGAFSSTNLQSIDLRENNIEFISTDAFEGLTLSNQACVDFPGWYLIPDPMDLSQTIVCSDMTNPLTALMMMTDYGGLSGALSYTMLEAVCIMFSTLEHKARERRSLSLSLSHTHTHTHATTVLHLWWWTSTWNSSSHECILKRDVLY